MAVDTSSPAAAANGGAATDAPTNRNANGNNTNNNTNTHDGSNTNAASSRGENREARRRKRKSRWGDQTATATTTSTTAATAVVAGGVAATSTKAAAAGTAAPQDAARAKVLAMQESIKARLAAAKAKQQQQQQTSSGIVPSVAGTKRPVNSSGDLTDTNKTKRARHFELDLSVTGPTFQKPEKQAAELLKSKPKINPYLAHLQQTHAMQPPAVTGKTESLSDGLKIDATVKSSSAAAADVSKSNIEQGDAPHDPDDVDMRLERTTKIRKQRRTLQFVEPGHWQQIAQKKREKAAKAEASGYVSGRKTGHTIQSTSMADVYGRSSGDNDRGDEFYTRESFVDLPPRADADPETSMPLIMEWWDASLLPSKLKKEVAAQESKLLSQKSKEAMQKLSLDTSLDPTAANTDTDGKNDAGGSRDDVDGEDASVKDLRKRCYEQASLAYSKTAELVQHIVPIEPRIREEVKPVLHLTKKEMKRQRKLRRQEKQRELQDLQAAGLVPTPEPRLTLKNFIRVLGDQAYLDPSQMEQKVMEQMQARQRAHLERNAANKLTKEQRAEKRIRKLQKEDAKAAGQVSVALFWVLDMSHPYHRAKVEKNAQQNNITGGVLECPNPAFALVICEGNPKAIKRYRRLMEVRMKWTGPDDQPDEDDDDDDDDGDAARDTSTRKFNPKNECYLVWHGMAVKRHFKGFVFQACDNADQARKVLNAKGVAHYWDQVLEFHTGKRQGRNDNLLLRLTNDDDDENSDDDSSDGSDNDEDAAPRNDNNHKKEADNSDVEMG